MQCEDFVERCLVEISGIFVEKINILENLIKGYNNYDEFKGHIIKLLINIEKIEYKIE